MPFYIREALTKHDLMPDYRARPAYQQHDYVGWIDCAKREKTREKRLRQMFTELERGDRYMNVRWRGK